MRARSDRPQAVTGRLVGLRLFAVLAAASMALHLPGLTVHLFNSDEASLATMAMVIDRGGRLYHETADRKPPVVPYLYAAVAKATGTQDVRPVRAVGAVVLAATAALLAAEARRRYRNRTAALGAAALFLLGTVAFFPADTQAAGFELFMLLPMTAAVVAAGRDRAVAAGVLLALACLCKQTAVTTALPVAWLLFRGGGWRPVVRAGVAGTGVIAATAVAFGPSEFLLWTVTGNGGYLALRGSAGATVLRGLGMTWAFIGINLALVLLAVRAAARSAWPERSGRSAWPERSGRSACPERSGLPAWPERSGRRAVNADVWLWLAGAAVGVFAGLRFFGHYYLQLLPPLVLAAAAALPTVKAPVRRLAFGFTGLSAAVMWAVAFLPANERGLLPYGSVAASVRRLTTPSETIFVWGEFPEIYWAANREPATRFIHTGFLTGNSGGRPAGTARPEDGLPGGWSLLEEDLRRNPPALILDTTEAHIRNSHYYRLDRTPVWPQIRADYILVGTIDGVRFYRHEPRALG